jgi:hypothetical protein
MDMFAGIRFLWNATRGHRLRPWRSDYLKWRIETYSGMKAESIRAIDIFRFVWREKWELLQFLFWVGRLSRETRTLRNSIPKSFN